MVSEPASAVCHEDVEPLAPLQSYDRWERQPWSIAELGLVADRDAWRALPDFIAGEIRGAIDRFFLGETAVTDTLAPIAYAAPDIESRIFLCTQLADEARHVLFFARYLEAVGEWAALAIGDYARRGWEASSDRFAGLLDRELRELATALTLPHSREDWYRAVTLYHLLVEGILGVSAQRGLLEATARFDGLAAFRRGLRNVARDESRHIRFGVGMLQQGTAAGFGEAIAAQVLESLASAVWVLIAPERALPALLPTGARRRAAQSADRQLRLAYGALRGRLVRIGLGAYVEAVADAWEQATQQALDEYRSRHGRDHPLRELVTEAG